jgi:membrane protein
MSDSPRETKLPAFVERLPGPVRSGVEILARTVDEFLEDGAPRLAAALAYYLLIAAAPILIVIVTLGVRVLEQTEVRDQLIAMANSTFGDAGATVVNEVLQQLSTPSGGATATTIFGIGIALFGASAAFSQLQTALNIAWGIPPRPEGFGHMLRRRGWAFLAVLIIGVLFVASFVLSSGLANAIGGWMPSFPGLTWVTEQGASFLGTTVLCIVLFTVLPDRRVEWRDTVVGSLMTALLFTVGSSVLGIYMGRGGVASLQGVAGSLAVVLVWLYYSTQVLLFGAEFTHVWSARRREAGIKDSRR